MFFFCFGYWVLEKGCLWVEFLKEILLSYFIIGVVKINLFGIWVYWVVF